MTTTQTLGKVVGANLRRIRNEREATLEEVSRAVRECGVEWSVSRVTAIQRGTRDPQLATILLLANALDCTVADLLETDAGQVDIGSVAVEASALRALFTDQTPAVAGGDLTNSQWAVTRGYGNAQHMQDTLGESVTDLRAWAMGSGLLETRTSTMLDIDVDVLNAVTYRTFGTAPMSRVRDQMAEEAGCLPAEVTGNLRELLREAISGWTHQQRRPTEYPD